MVFITRRERFNAAHKLYKEDWSAEKNLEVFGKCSNPNWHGHNYELYITVKGVPDAITGFVIDLKELGDIVFSDKAPTKLAGKDAIIVEGSEQSFEALPKPQWQALAETEATPDTATDDDAAPSVEGSNVIYRWTDASGQRHFSQTKPEGDYPLEIIKTP